MSTVTLANCRGLLLLLLLTTGASAQVQGQPDHHLWVVFYATHAGKTGHVGIALDKQRVKVLDDAAAPGGVRYDTIPTGELVYYDLWPAREDYSWSFFFGQVPATYNCLPTSSAAPPVTVGSLLRKGIPYVMERPPDGLLRLPVSPTAAAELTVWLAAQSSTGRAFSLYDYNCSDFVLTALQRLYPGLSVHRERVLSKRATTPNRLWRAVAILPDAFVLQDPGDKVSGRFNYERIFSAF